MLQQKNIGHFHQKGWRFQANILNVFSQNIQPFQAKTYNDSDSKRHKKSGISAKDDRQAGLL